jgi:hypothetical protein
MGAAWMLHHWAHRVRLLVPQLHGHQVKTLALMAWSMCSSGGCRVTTMTLAAPTSAQRASTRRRFERFLANDRIDVAGSAVDLGRALLQNFRGRTITLMLDETALGPWLNCMKVSVGYERRALPLAWTCYLPGRLPIPQPQIVELVLRQAALCVPANTRVVLMADRGLSWPSVIDLCRELGWDYLLRVQRQTSVRLQGGPTQRADQLVQRGGPACGTRGEVFQTAGWRACNIVAWWPRDQHEPWLLVTSLPPRRCRCAEYRRRMWQEESFRDEKSHGFGWQRSRVREPDHADRLLLVMQLAMWMVIAAGVDLVRRGARTLVECTSTATLSIFQLGYRWWRYIAPAGRAPPITLTLLAKSVG